MVMKWTKRLLIGLIGLVLVLYLVLLIAFNVWKGNYFGALEAGSKIAQTSLGAIEYARVGTGPVLLVLHGTPGSYEQGLFLAEHLVPAGFSVIAVSRPGYLRTPRETGLTLNDQVDAYVALLDLFEIDKVAVIGGSGGAPAAISMAMRYPERLWAVAHLFGLAGGLPPGDGAPAPPPTVSQRLILSLLGEGFVGWAMLSLNRQFPARLLLGEDMGMINDDARRRVLNDAEKLDRFSQMLWTGYPLRRERGLRLDVSQFRNLDQSQAHTIRIPTFFVHGDDDNNAPFEKAKALAEAIPGSEFQRVEGADHWIVITRPEDVYPGLVDFLLRHSPRTKR